MRSCRFFRVIPVLCPKSSNMKALIIGGGVAGTSLAHHLKDEGVETTLVDNGNNQSSRVAGGILNPLVFRRMTLSWRAGEFIPYAHDFYAQLERKLGVKFHFPLRIRRLFASEQEAGYWEKKQHLPEYQPFMHPLEQEDKEFPSPLNTHGTGRVLNASYVEAGIFYNAQLNWLEEQGSLLRESVDYSEINPHDSTYKGVFYDFIVFCQGKDGVHNPWFGYLPLQQTKGELLTVHAPTLSQEESLNRKCFTLPSGEGKFKVGSTYQWDTDNVEITPEARATICEHLASVMQEPYEVIDQVAGVRPTVTDRRPLIGRHSQFNNLVIANGLGTKGYILAPMITKELTDHLLRGTALHPESDIARFGTPE